MALTKELVGTEKTRILRVVPVKQKVAADLYQRDAEDHGRKPVGESVSAEG
jgi:hypothetical protein